MPMSRAETLLEVQKKIDEALALLDALSPFATRFEDVARNKLVAAIDNLRAAEQQH